METNKPAVTGLKKRQQITKANRLVFIWVTLAGIAVTIAIVLSQFMLKQFFFNNSVISTMTKTNDTLKKNAEAYEPLKTEVLKLVAAKELNDLRVNPEQDNALQVVIDAMPTVDDRIALAASLQQVILSRSGVKVELLAFEEPTTAALDPTTAITSPTSGSINEVPFTFKVTGTYEQLKVLMENMNQSIRPIVVTTIKLSGASNAMTAEVRAKTFYATPANTDLRQEVIKP